MRRACLRAGESQARRCHFAELALHSDVAAVGPASAPRPASSQAAQQRLGGGEPHRSTASMLSRFAAASLKCSLACAAYSGKMAAGRTNSSVSGRADWCGSGAGGSAAGASAARRNRRCTARPGGHVPPSCASARRSQRAHAAPSGPRLTLGEVTPSCRCRSCRPSSIAAQRPLLLCTSVEVELRARSGQGLCRSRRDSSLPRAGRPAG